MKTKTTRGKETKKRKKKDKNKKFNKLYASWCSKSFTEREDIAVVFKEQGEVSYWIFSGILVIIEPFTLIQDILPRLNGVYIIWILQVLPREESKSIFTDRSMIDDNFSSSSI